MRLFICHVSEDKSDFVEPLAFALREFFEVWYDKFQLTLGDNLLQKITEGLLTSDFGVVVLSKAFFAKKKWAENELGGLFALETATRKIILPVWKDVTAADVRAYSPILANKLAVSASAGLQKVVDEIRIAVSVSKRKDEIGGNAATSKVKALAQTLEERMDAERLASSAHGARLVSQSVENLFATIELLLTEGAGKSNVLTFGFRKPMEHLLYVNTIHGMYLGIHLAEFYLNSVSHATLEARIFQRKFGVFGDPHADGPLFEELIFRPTFRAGEVVWVAQEHKQLYRTNQLAGYLVEAFVRHISQQVNVA